MHWATGHDVATLTLPGDPRRKVEWRTGPPLFRRVRPAASTTDRAVRRYATDVAYPAVDGSLGTVAPPNRPIPIR